MKQIHLPSLECYSHMVAKNPSYYEPAVHYFLNKTCALSENCTSIRADPQNDFSHYNRWVEKTSTLNLEDKRSLSSRFFTISHACYSYLYYLQYSKQAGALLPRNSMNIAISKIGEVGKSVGSLAVFAERTNSEGVKGCVTWCDSFFMHCTTWEKLNSARGLFLFEQLGTNAGYVDLTTRFEMVVQPHYKSINPASSRANEWVILFDKFIEHDYQILSARCKSNKDYNGIQRLEDYFSPIRIQIEALQQNGFGGLYNLS